MAKNFKYEDAVNVFGTRISQILVPPSLKDINVAFGIQWIATIQNGQECLIHKTLVEFTFENPANLTKVENLLHDLSHALNTLIPDLTSLLIDSCSNIGTTKSGLGIKCILVKDIRKIIRPKIKSILDKYLDILYYKGYNETQILDALRDIPTAIAYKSGYYYSAQHLRQLKKLLDPKITQAAPQNYIQMQFVPFMGVGPLLKFELQV